MYCSKCRREMPENALYCPWCGKTVNNTPKRKKRGNGQGTAYKRGSTWTAEVTDYYFVDEAGKKHRKKLTKGGFPTKRDAIAYCTRIRTAEKKVPTLLELYTVYETSSLPKLSKDKQTAYKKARERLEPLMGKKISSLTTADLQTVINENSSSYYTARDMKVLLSHLYKAACADQFVTTNLAAYVVLPTLEEKEPVPFTAEEVNKMWTAFADGDTFVGYLLLMIYSGMMPGELFSCEKSMVDLDRCEIYGCGRKTKTRKSNAIVFADVVRPVVEELCQGEGKLCHLYETEWYDEYHRTTARIGIRDLPPYSCRHTTGTEAARMNLNASIIQKIMRHSKITTSQRYIHLGTEEAHSGINSITHTLPTSEPQAVENTGD